MVAKALGQALLLCLLPTAALALGLGDIRLNSGLNAPLDAEVELIEATPEELATLKAQLASRETFARYGLEWPAFLANVSVQQARRADGRTVLRLKSADVVTEPFLTLLVEVNWARGRLMREYTVLLDPPVFAPDASAATAPPVAAAVTGADAQSGAIERPRPAPAPVDQPPAADAATEPEPAPPLASGDYEVQRGDTLSAIASRLTAGAEDDTRRLMVGLFQTNPDAFTGNMNQLRAGAVLRVPDEATLAAIPVAEARAEVRRQYAAWRGSAAATAPATEAERLRLVPADGTPAGVTSAAPGAVDAAAAAEVASLQSRVRQLESDLAESRRLIELRNAELAQLQARLANAETPDATASTPAAATDPSPAVPESAVAPEDAAPVEPPVAASDPALETAPGEGPDFEVPATADAVDPVAAAPEATAPVPAEEAEPRRPPRTPSAPAAEEGPSLLDTLLGLWWVPLLLLALGGGWFGYRKWQERQAATVDDTLGRLATAGVEQLEARAPSATDTARLRKPAGPRDAESFLVEESGARERPAFAGAPAAAPKPARVVTTPDQTLSGETAINLDQGDPLAEADFHMAYGLYDQAADLVRIAIQREPARRDLKLKLLEVFFVWGNKEQFLQTARELAGSRASAPAGEWDKIVIMGRQLAPEDPIFQQAGSGAGAIAGGIDLDLEGGQNRIDYDLLGDPSATASNVAGVDLDFGTALGDKDPTGEARAVEAEGLDFEVGDELGADRSGNTTREMTAKMPPAARFGDDGADSGEAPTIEQPALRSEVPTIKQKVDMALKQKGLSDQTAELAIDDLGLDLDGLDGESTGADAPTMVAGLDDRSRRIMAEAERRAGAADTSASGQWMLDAASQTGRNPALPDSSPTSSMRALSDPGDANPTSRLAAVKPEDVDIDFSATDAQVGNGAALDLDVGPALAGDATGTFASTQKVGPEDLALPDLEPVTMSEVGTKLDLARAYMDMGDPDGARSILKEVLQEGSVSQKQEAQRLMEALPG
jgi:pilus assembly protein FimV